MGRYYYPNASNALDAKKMFLREHGYKISHCFQNKGASGYVLFDTKEEVNLWWKELTGKYFYDEEYEPGTRFTEEDAIREIENSYGRYIDEELSKRDFSMPIMAVGLPYTYGNRMLITFSKSTEERDIAYRFYLHYDGFTFDVNPNISNLTLRQRIISLIFKHFYHKRFKKRIEGSKDYNKSKENERLKEDELRRQQEAEQERELRYQTAYQQYLVDRKQYEKEISVFNQAMAVKERFTYGGQFPNGAGFICFLLLLVVIFISMGLTILDGIIPHTLLVLIDVIFLIVGYRVIFKKLKPYIEEKHFDEQSFQQWVDHNPNSPFIRYIRHPYPPLKPTPPSR